jgi:hypothetical protein
LTAVTRLIVVLRESFELGLARTGILITDKTATARENCNTRRDIMKNLPSSLWIVPPGETIDKNGTG